MNKRARHSSPKPTVAPFHYDLKAVDKSRHRGIHRPVYSVTATLSIPTEDEECPLTLDLISQSQLPFLPEKTPFLLDRPQHTKLTLPCGHAFSAMTLIYNFCKNNMMCPCCRSGKEERMDINCLPRHLRADFRAQIQDILNREALEQEREDMMDIAGFVSVMQYTSLAANDRLFLQMEFFSIPSPLPLHTRLTSVFCMTTSLRDGAGVGANVTLEPRTDLRGISNVAHMGVNAMRLSVILSMLGVGQVAIDATPITMLPQVSDEAMPRCMSVAGVSNLAMTQQNGLDVIIQLNAANSAHNNQGAHTRFCIHFAQSAAFAHLLIRNIVWHPGAETIAVMSSDARLATSIYG